MSDTVQEQTSNSPQVADKLPPIIGLRGAIGSGKDTAAEFLSYYFGYKVMGFSDPVYESLYRLNPAIPVAHHRFVYLQTLVDSMGWDTAKRKYPAIRQGLRVIGTENGREVHGNDCWLKIASSRMQQSDCPRFVFRDVRFPEEATFIRNRGGEIWLIDGRTSPELAILPEHKSEQQQFAVDRLIMNDSTIPVFQRRITEILKGKLS
jgi:hypothetical protein